MRERVEFWRRGRGRIYHIFTESTDYCHDGEPRWSCMSLCERHEFTKDHRSVYLYDPWMGDDFPTDKQLCAKCKKEWES